MAHTWHLFNYILMDGSGLGSDCDKVRINNLRHICGVYREFIIHKLFLALIKCRNYQRDYTIR